MSSQAGIFMSSKACIFMSSQAGIFMSSQEVKILTFSYSSMSQLKDIKERIKTIDKQVDNLNLYKCKFNKNLFIRSSIKYICDREPA